MKGFVRNIFTAMIVTLLGFLPQALGAVTATAHSLTFQGRILKSDGTPLEYSNVGFIFQITDPSGACIIYQEQISGYNMINSGGVFDVPIGTGSVSWPSGVSTVVDTFNNSATFTCGSCSGYTCAAGTSTYSPVTSDGRLLHVSFFDGTGWKIVSPDTAIRTVPFAGYAQSALKLGTNSSSDFVLKANVNSGASCGSGSFLTWDSTTQAFGCSAVSGSSGGTVTNVTASSPLLVTNGTSTPNISIQPASSSQNGYLSSTDWTTFNNKLSTSSAFSGDVSGTSSSTSVDKIKSIALNISSITSGQFLKYNGTNWVNSNIAQSDVTGLATTLSGYLTTSSFNADVAAANCSASQSMYWSSVTSAFACQTISVSSFSGSLAGDVSGTQGATSVDKIKGVTVSSTAPTSNQVLQYNGTNWAPATISTTPSGSAGGDLTGTYPNPTLATIVTTGTGTKITYDAKGRVTSSTSLSASDIPNLSWSKITSGTPTTLSGYGITDSLVTNAGNAVSLQSGTSASRPTAGTAGRIYLSTDTQVLYYDNGTSWITIASNAGAGGTITALTSDVSASGSGSVAATVNSVGGSTAANVHSAEVIANAATNANTASTIVKRDASGNFSAGTITANLTGNVTGSASLNVLKAGDSMSGSLTHAASTGDVYTAGSGSNTATVQGPSTAIGTSYVLRLPTSVPGTSGQALVSDTSGNLSWSSLTSGTVTSVTATSPLISSGGTTPALSLAGLTGLGTANQILGMNSGATAYEYKTISGTSNQITVTNATNSITLTTPQNIHTAASPTFAGMTLSGMSTAGIVKNNASGVLSGGNSISMTSDISGVLPVANGGTNASSFTNYSVIASNSSGSALTAVSGSVNGSILQYSATGPVFSTASYPSTTTASQLLYSSANNVVGGLATVNSAVLTTNSSGVPIFSAISGDLFSQYALLAGRSGGQTLYGGTAASNGMTIDSTSNATKGNIILNPSGGNVGIGTTSPGEVLQVAGAVKVTGAVATATASSTALDYWSGASRIVSYGPTTSTYSAFNIVQATSNGSASIVPFYINSSGNVGIGTTSPATALHVVGTATATSLATGAGQAFKIRYGTGSATINSVGPVGSLLSLSVSYGYTFASSPVVTVTGNSAGNWLDCLIPTAQNPTTTGFTLVLTLPCAQTATGTYNFSWTAIGN